MKIRPILYALFICVLAFTSLQAQQVQSGDFFFNSATPGYTLNNNQGQRSVEREITFAKPFDFKPHVYLTITVVDAKNKTKIRYSAEAKGVSRDGFVAKIVTWGDTQIEGIGGHWFAIAEKLEIKKEEIKVGTTFQLNNVYFEFNKWNLLPESYPELDNVVNFLKENGKVEIEVSGHTDNIGSDSYNMELSQKRAESVRSYLVSKGITDARITSKGYGKTKPIAPNNTDAGREQNRRVEFTITKS